MRAAEESAVASRYDREVVGLATVVATANAYFQVLAAQDRLRSRAQESATSATRILNLIKQRLNAGTASALEVAAAAKRRQHPEGVNPAAGADAASRPRTRWRC